MKKALLIAEKPSLMRDIQRAYKKCAKDIEYDIDFTAQFGHLIELKDPAEMNPIYVSWDEKLLPIEPENEGGWQYKVKKSTKKQYEEIKKMATSGKYDVIIHAGDPDQEGELLVNLVLQQFNNKLPVLRFWANDTTQDGIINALKNLKSDDEPMYKNLMAAALIRQHSDYRFGMNGSRALGNRLYAKGNTIAVGRVMTAVQSTIVKREDEIINFIPKTTYGLNVNYANGLSGYLYEDQKETVSDEETNNQIGVKVFDTEESVRDLIDTLNDSGKIISVDKKRTTSFAPKLYKLATLQMDAAKLGYSANDTLEIIQSLYEKHLLSYPRTDCEVISSNENFRGILSSCATFMEFSKEVAFASTRISNVKSIKKYVNDAELKKHGHSAIIPTTEKPDLEQLSNKELDIYSLVVKRFLAIFQLPLIQDKTTVISEVEDYNGNKYLFRSSGKIVVDKGFTEFLETKVNDIEIPLVNEGETYSVSSFDKVEKISQKPKRFTDGTLIAAMENPTKYLTDKTIKEDIKDLSIGTPATRAGIIEKLIKDKYIKRVKNNLVPTDFGSFMIHTINDVSLCNIDTTGHWEQMLLKIRNGELSLAAGEEIMKEETVKLINEIKLVNKTYYGDANNYKKEPIMTCPSCGKDIMEGPKNFYCLGYSDGCKYTLIKNFLGATFTKEDAINLFNGNTVEKKLTKKDKSATWMQKLKFNATEGKLDFIQAQKVDIGIQCPDCMEELQRQGDKVSCPSCDFTLWANVCKRRLTNDELRDAIEKGKTKELSGFVSKAGKKFKARLVLEKNGEKSMLKFKFNS